jgi:hypothetical protein
MGNWIGRDTVTDDDLIIFFHFHIDFMIDFIETHVELILEFLHVLFPLDGVPFERGRVVVTLHCRKRKEFSLE